VPKNYYFQLTNEFFDLSIKVNTKKSHVILPAVKHE